MDLPSLIAHVEFSYMLVKCLIGESTFSCGIQPHEGFVVLIGEDGNKRKEAAQQRHVV